MLQDIKSIYDYLGDDKSKEIYANRLMFSLTGDRRYITRIVADTALYQLICEMLSQDKREKYIAGAGQWGKIIADLFCDFKFSGFVDNNVTGTYKNLPIISMKEFLDKKPNAVICISTTTFHDEFYRLFNASGIQAERIIDISGMMLEVYHTQQYFDLPCLLEQNLECEIFIDGGCYDGANSRQFVQWAKNAKKKVYAFEPDVENAKKCAAVLEEMEGVSYELIPKGLWSSDTVLNFRANSNEASGFAENGKHHVAVTSLDAAVKEKITFIKMDIEGAEYEALRGSENLIRRYRPKLAISIYHKNEDIWKLPQLILSFYSGYIFYLRHYSLSSEETVLYAVPSGKEEE